MHYVGSVLGVFGGSRSLGSLLRLGPLFQHAHGAGDLVALDAQQLLDLLEQLALLRRIAPPLAKSAALGPDEPPKSRLPESQHMRGDADLVRDFGDRVVGARVLGSFVS